MSDAIRQLADSGPIRLAMLTFLVGMAWANLHAEITLDKVERDTQLAQIQTELLTIKVVVCRATPHDSMCALK